MDQADRAPKSISLTLRRPPTIIATAVTVAILGSATAWWLIAHTKPIPAKYRQGLNFQLYYPQNLPKGYIVDKHSFQRKNKVLIFNISSPSGKNIAVAEQHIPQGLDLSQHPNPSGVSLPDQRNFTTAAGSAQISLWGDKLVSSLVTPNTWVILNVTGFKMDDGQMVTESFSRL